MAQDWNLKAPSDLPYTLLGKQVCESALLRVGMDGLATQNDRLEQHIAKLTEELAALRRVPGAAVEPLDQT